ALKKHDTQKMLMSVKARFYGTENHEVKSRMLEIAADVLGTAASDWVRELWENDADKFFHPLSWAAASSLPAEEGMRRIFDQLKCVSEKELPMTALSSLYRFRSHHILDWMESHCSSFHDSWGQVGISMLSNMAQNEILAKQRKTFQFNCTRYNGELSSS
ncbi:hypothetical protein U5O17_19125, partial [Bacillus altitudinis]